MPPAARVPSLPSLLHPPSQIVDLAPCKKLARLDVSKNELTSLDGLGACTALRWLSAAGNAITTEGAADALKDLEHLEVRPASLRMAWLPGRWRAAQCLAVLQ